MDDIGKLLRAREEALLAPAVRKNRSQVEALLADDFVEFGSSGQVWSHGQILALLADETPAQMWMENFSRTLFSNEVALVKYRAVRIDPASGGADVESAQLDLDQSIGTVVITISPGGHGYRGWRLLNFVTAENIVLLAARALGAAQAADQ